MRNILEIELRSDLCAGTGAHYAAVIDLDTAIDEYGIPFIPSKRLKGCMREIAGLFLENDEINRMFGEKGGEVIGSLSISDAKIRGYDNQLDDIKAAIKGGDITANDITELFCAVRAETAIENDTAKDGSLRFTRVVNRLSPIDGNPLKFYAEIEFDNSDKDTVEKICKGLRNIGYKRNRGFGHIKCTVPLLPCDNSTCYTEQSFENDKTYRLEYLVFLEDDVMLPASDANNSLDFIPGTSVLGAFAGRYIKKYGEAQFNDIFLSKRVKFGNLYFSDKDGTDYSPAPRFLAKIKAAKEDEKGIHNMVANKEADEKKETKPQYKPLKKGYINADKGYKEVETEIVYHNALNTEESRENNGGLYTQYCISSGQYFKGYIEADGEAMLKIYPLFESGNLSFGRSKTAQYSHCRVVGIKSGVAEDKTAEIKSGNTVAYICESDIALTKEGRYTVSLDDFCEAAGLDAGSLTEFTGIAATVISGYNAKWNLKKPQFPVIKAGSVLVFTADKDFVKSETFCIGEKQNEGFGKIRVIEDVKAYSVNNSLTKEKYAGSELVEEVIKKKNKDKIIAEAVEYAKEFTKDSFDSSNIGRLTLMCKEAGSFENFGKRISSIKNDKLRSAADELIGKKAMQDKFGNDWSTAKAFIIKTLTVVKYQFREKESK